MEYVNKAFWMVLAVLFLVAFGVPIPLAIVLGMLVGIGLERLEMKLKVRGEKRRNGKADKSYSENSVADQTVAEMSDADIEELASTSARLRIFEIS